MNQGVINMFHSDMEDFLSQENDDDNHRQQQEK